ncbi:class I adenylate-forming enzyme family protein [Streptomyces sp. NPDC021093]|uniref:class I adenylate-forming enzyme family protein n=1 Tax=Streptomyces sp. NPDC021093 TaxID=3365112 RepID=UPI0037ABB655
MHQQVEEHAAARPDAPAVRVLADGRWRGTSWRELRDRAAGAAEWAERTVGRDSPVVLVLDNSAESLAVFLGLTAASVDLLCLEANSSHLDAERSVARRIGARYVIGPDGGSSGSGSGHGNGSSNGNGSDTTAYAEVRGDPGGPLRAPDRSPEILGLTSGSTGEPRIVRQHLANIERGGRLYAETYGYTPADRLLGPIPMAHSFGMMGLVAGALTAGAEIVTTARFSVSAVHTAIDEGATVLLGTPMIYRILGMAPRPTGSGTGSDSGSGTGNGTALRALLSSGGPLPPGTRAQAEQVLGLPVHQIYGSTEAGVIACQYDREEPWPEGSAGRIHPSATWRIAPAQTGAGSATGRLLVRTTMLFTGYLDDGDVRDEAVFDEDGLYDTGDLVTIDASGDLTVLARRSTFINVGGRKVDPGRVGDVLGAHADVVEAHVFGHEADGEESVHAAVVLRDPQGGVADLLTYVRGRLAAYEVPHQLHVLAALPRTTLGKPDLAAVKRACALLPAVSAGSQS